MVGWVVLMGWIGDAVDGLRGSGCVQMDWVGYVFNVIVV